jgi:peptidyl-prolyl cis-trans isomerase B (cyclophilin B)
MRTTTLCLALALMAASSVVTRAAADEKKQYDKPGDMKIDPKKTYTATIDTSEGKIVVQLMPDKAPQTVNSFVFLAKEKFYDGLTFHRVIKDFMIQGGDPAGNGTGGPGYQLKAEFNDVKHEPGVLSMARARNPDSAGSQFFIMHGTNAGLDGQYTAFGKVTEGQAVVDKIANVQTGANDRPVKDVTIKSITIDEKDAK